MEGTTKKFPSVLFPTFVGGGGGKTGKELFPPYEVFSVAIAT